MRMLLLALLIFPVVACANVYRWTDSQGVVHYSDQPTGHGARLAELPELQIAEPPPKLTETQPGRSHDAAETVSLQLLQPAPGTILRKGVGEVPVQVSLARPLQNGEHLVYFLDGQAVIEESRRTSAELHGITRGTHHVSVALIHNGRPVARTDAVKFYVERPSVISPTAQSSPQSSATPVAPSTDQAAGVLAAPH